jgi:hypothetical protein
MTRDVIAVRALFLAGSTHRRRSSARPKFFLGAKLSTVVSALHCNESPF